MINFTDVTHEHLKLLIKVNESQTYETELRFLFKLIITFFDVLISLKLHKI